MKNVPRSLLGAAFLLQLAFHCFLTPRAVNATTYYAGPGSGASGRGITISQFNAASGITTLASVAPNQFVIETLTGNGGLNLHASGSTTSVLGLAVNTTAGYGGNMKVLAGPGTVDFNSDLICSGWLEILQGGRILLDRNLNFSRVTVTGTELQPGTYNASYLTSTYPSIFTWLRRTNQSQRQRYAVL